MNKNILFLLPNVKFEEDYKNEYYGSYLELMKYLKKSNIWEKLGGAKSFTFFISTAIYRPYYFENLLMLAKYYKKKENFEIRNKIIFLYFCEEIALIEIKKYIAQRKWRKICIYYKLFYHAWYQDITYKSCLKLDLKYFIFHNQYGNEIRDKANENIENLRFKLDIPESILD